MFDLIAIALFLVLIFIFKPDKKIESGEVNTTEYCEGGKCKNTCQKVNATLMKSGGIFNAGFDSDGNEVPDIKFQASDCDEGTKLIQNFDLCGSSDNLPEDQIGEVECTSRDCCANKTCGSDRFYSPDDMLDYLQAKNNITEEDRVLITSSDTFSIDTFYSNEDTAITDERRRILDDKINRDGYCPYQMTAVNKSTGCIGETTGIGGDCTIDECCIPKTCANNWVSDQNPEWGSQTTCPHQPDNVEQGSMIKYPDDKSCDSCDISECCYEQRDYCIVEANGVYNHANTNVQNVAFPSGTSLSFPGNDNTSVDLTTNYFLSKTDIETNTDNIKDILSFGVVGGNINSDNNFGIKCEDGFKYGMCSSTDDSIDDDACKTHDNNQRDCEAAGCSFTLGDRPRVEYDECGGNAAHHNIIKVPDCINTCTADYTLSDNGINYFTQTPISDGIYRVNPDFYSNKLNTDNDYPYSEGEIPMDCYNHTGTGNSLHYNYTCGGGGSYFGVSELRNCNTTCGQLHDEGLRCGQGNIYDSEKADNISSYANFRETGDDGCCMPVTCDTLSNGQSVSCLPHQTRRTDTQTQDSAVSRDSCCVNKTCTDFMNDYNSLSGEEAKDNTNICLDGRNFNSDRELTSAYLYQVSDSDSDKLRRLTEYRSGSADYDIGCCSNLTCGEWLNNNLENLGIPDNDQKLIEASRMCGSGKFFVSDMFAGDMGETITGDSPCCVGESDSTCIPTQELVSTSLGFTIPGYTLPDDIQFSEKTFNMDTSSGGGEYSIDADDIICSDGFTPSDEGIKYKCRINPSTGDGIYYLSGCNSGTPDTDETGTGGNTDKLCSLPTHLENSIQLNGFSFDASNNVVNFNHFLGNQDQFSCNESTEIPIFTECSEDFTEMIISGCHYQDKPTTDGENFYSDRFFRYNEHIHGEDRESSGHPCENLYTITATDNQYNEDGDIIGTTPDDYRDELISIETHINEIDPPTGGGDIPSNYAINKMKGNVSNFSCKCSDGDNECPDHERQVRFKYIFANDEDYYNGDNGFITNQQAIDDPNNIYPLEQILSGGSATVCEPGYYPYRGAKYDYCKPCDDLYKNNHPISAIAKSLCDSGHMGDSGSVTNLLNITSEQDSMNSKYESNSGDISTLRAVREVGEGECRSGGGSVIQSISTRQDCVHPNIWSVTETNEDYSPYLGNLGEDFMTADNFTLGTRVCDPEPGSGTACAPKVKIYGNYSQPATEGSQFEKAKKWWRTYFNNIFNNDGGDTDNSDILDISSAPSPETPKSTLKSRINRQKIRSELNSDFITNREGIRELKVRVRNAIENNPELINTTGSLFYIDDHIDNNLTNRYMEDYTGDDGNFDQSKLGYRARNSGVGFIFDYDITGDTTSYDRGPNGGESSYSVNYTNVNTDIFNKYMHFDNNIDDISKLKKEDYLYRDSLKIEDSEGTSQYISTVCNNNTSEVDYIPSFDSVDSNEGSCKECVNEMPTDDKLIQDGNAPPNTPGDYIIRNIDNDNYTPICSYEANMYNESYNEGNIVGFKSKSDNSGEIFIDQGDDPRNGPCEDGFRYNNDGFIIWDMDTGSGHYGYYTNLSLQNYVKCMPSPKYITQFCENITDEIICNKSFSGYLTRDEEGRLSNDLKEKLEENERQMINNLKRHGFCGWVGGKCQNIYKFPDHHLAHKLSSDRLSISDEHYSDENYSEHKSLHKLQSAMESLSPHITNYASSDKYDYSNLYNSILSEEAYDGHPTHRVNDGGIKPPSDPVFNISNYGVGKDGGDTTHLGDDLISLSIANALKEGYGLYNPPSDPRYEGALYDIQYPRYSRSDFTGFDNPDQGPLVPTRINPTNTILNYDMRNRCHPILWDGPVDFFYENERLDKTTISSSCYLRDGSTLNASGDHIVPNGSGDYSIKSTPLYYDKGRNLLGGSIVDGNYSARDKANNILNPGENRDGIMYAEPQTDSQSIGTNDSGFTDAAIFPLIDRVRGCFNDSLIYDSEQHYQQLSSLGLGDDNIQNEREQCIRYFNQPDGILRCVRACLNHDECDLVRWKHMMGYHGSCELLKWNKLPDTITEKTTRLNPGNNQGTYSDVSGTISNYNLGGHLINANTELYDQSTRQGVVNWLERVRGGSDGTQPGEMNHTVTVGDNGQYRTDFYSPLPGDNWSDLRDWRMNHLVKDGSSPPGQEIEIKGRSLWRSTGNYNDEEVWISMNKIRAPTPDGKITDILNNINDHELPDIRHMGHGRTDNWRKSYSRSHTNEESIYYSNDSSIQNFPDKFNEKTVILDTAGSLSYYECPPGTYVQGTDGNYKCSQVINECADCQDIFNYHNKKGDFVGMDTDGEKNEILLSYGCSVDSIGDSPGVFIGDDLINAIPGGNPNRANPGTPATENVNYYDTGFNINDSINPPYETVNKHPNGVFSGQHNLMAKTPDGNIIDAERCRCPEGKTVRTKNTRMTWDNHTRPIGKCG